MRPALLLVILALLSGCPAPVQYGGPIAVDREGFASRMAWLCRWGMEGANASTCLQELQPDTRPQQDDGGAPSESASPGPQSETGAPAPEAGPVGGDGAQDPSSGPM